MLRHVLPWVRIGFGVLVVSAVVAQITNLVRAEVFDPTRFFLFFTILSNLLATAVFLEGGRRQLTRRPPVPDLWRGAAVVFMTVTFVVFAVLLRGLQEELQTNIVWVDTVLHRLMPVAVMVDWLVAPPRRRLSARAVLLPWLGPPLAWAALTLVRGALDGWYPYPFLDPANGGYGAVSAYVAGIVVLFLLVTGVVVVAGNAMRDRVGEREAPGLERTGTGG